jgi:hypothetical protein
MTLPLGIKIIQTKISCAIWTNPSTTVNNLLEYGMTSLVILFSYIFIKIIVQSSVFIKYSDSTTTIIFVYVDDNIITENNEKKNYKY